MSDLCRSAADNASSTGQAVAGALHCSISINHQSRPPNTYRGTVARLWWVRPSKWYFALTPKWQDAGWNLSGETDLDVVLNADSGSRFRCTRQGGLAPLIHGTQQVLALMFRILSSFYRQYQVGITMLAKRQTEERTAVAIL